MPESKLFQEFKAKSQAMKNEFYALARVVAASRIGAVVVDLSPEEMEEFTHKEALEILGLGEPKSKTTP